MSMPLGSPVTNAGQAPTTLSNALATILITELEGLRVAATEMIPPDRRPSQRFWEAEKKDQQVFVLRACLLVFVLSLGKVVPRDFQLEAVLGSLGKKDVIVSSGTGSGKTLIMLMLMLLRPLEVSLVIVPLKRLQKSQLEAFAWYEIKAVVINEDTPDNKELWKQIENGEFTCIITTMEQLGIFDGHMTKLGRLLRLRDRKFVNRIKYIHIDKVQTVQTCGVAKYGQPPFRPSYGRFDAYRLLFSKEAVVMAYSATLPPHILRVVTRKITIAPDHLFLKRTSNRSNIMYATHPIIGSLSDYQNLSMLLPSHASCLHPESIPLTIVFHDDVKGCTNAALYMRGLLPPAMCGVGLIAYYHSLMSHEYLEKTYQDFQAGKCRILHTCAGMESGIDFNRVDLVCQYGIATDGTTVLQRGGRGGRNPNDRSLYLIMYEPFVKELDVSHIPAAEIAEDPDRPFSISSNKRQPKTEHIGCFCIHLVQSGICIRRLFADYLGDDSIEALHFTTDFCCDRHGNGFDLSKYVSSPVYAGPEPKVRKPPQRKPRGRPVKERPPLHLLIRAWRARINQSDPLGAICPPRWILDDSKIKTLAAALPSAIRIPSDIVDLLESSTEWSNKYAASLFDVIQLYNTSAPHLLKKRPRTPPRAPLVDKANTPRHPKRKKV